jgi:hypothetical protein
MGNSPLRDWVKTVPFLPFTVSLSNGRTVAINSPEMIILGQNRDTAAFVDEEGFDRIVVIPHQHINTIDAYDPHQTTQPPE